jgi:hypothetical protein
MDLQQEQQQQQQPSLAALFGNTSELLLLDQLRYLPYSRRVNHATATAPLFASAPAAAAAAAAEDHDGGPHHDEDEGDDAVASSVEQRIAPQGDLMYWLRWLLAQVRAGQGWGRMLDV